MPSEEFDHREIKQLKERLAQAEQALAKARARLEGQPQAGAPLTESQIRAMLEYSSEAFTLVNPAGKVIYSNPASLRIGSYTQEERLSHSTLDLVHPDDLPTANASLQRLAANPGSSENLTLRILAKDRSVLWIKLHAVNLLAEPGVAAMVIHYQDVTARVLAEQALLASETEKKNILDSLTAHIARVDEHGTILTVNHAWHQFLQQNDGLSQTSEAGVDYLAVCDRAATEDHDPTAAAAADGIRRVLNGTLPEFHLEYPCDSPSAKRWFNMHVTPIFGEHLGAVIAHEAVTERKLAELALYDSDQRFRDVLENSIDAAYKRDLRKDSFDYIAPAIERISGYTPDEFSSMDLTATLQHFHPEDLPHIQQSLAGALASHSGVHRLEYRFKHRDGAYRWFLDRFTVVRDTQDQPSYLIGSVEDITPRRQAEQALRENQARLELALDAAGMGTFYIDMEHPVPNLDAQACRLFGLDPQSFIGTPQEIMRNVLNDDLEQIKSKMQLVMQSELPYESQYRIAWPDGSQHHIAARGRLYRDENGQPLRVHGILWDITGRVEAEEALRESEATLNSFFNSTQAMMGIIRILPEADDLQYLRLNSAAVQYLGCPPESIPGLRASQTSLSTGNRRLWLEQCRLSRESGRPMQFEYQRNFPDGVHWLLATINSIEPEIFSFTADNTSVKPEVFSFAAADITGIKHMQHELQQLNAELEERVAQRTAELSRANDELKRLVRLKDEFLSNMSHELRTPLTAIIGLSEALQIQVYGDLSERQVRALKNIYSSGLRLQALIDNLMDLSQLAAGKIDLQPGPVVMERLIKACLDQVRPEAVRKNIELFSRRDAQMVYLLADERRLKQILVGMLDNAVKFTPADGTVGLEVQADLPAEQVHWVVWDTGIGIPQELQQQLFEPFVQLDGGLAREYGGIGLGMAMVNRLVELHGGSIRIESAPGQGSRFIVTLPWRRLEE